MAARRAGLWSQLCHGFAFTEHQALHKMSCSHSLCISHWCFTSHHLSVLLANKALWMLMAFCWLLALTGCRWELSRTCEQRKAWTWFTALETRTRYWTLWNLSISKATHKAPDRILENSPLNMLFQADSWTWVLLHFINKKGKKTPPDLVWTVFDFQNGICCIFSRCKIRSYLSRY